MPLGGVLEASWGVLEASWRSLGGVLGGLGGILEAIRGLLEPSSSSCRLLDGLGGRLGRRLDGSWAGLGVVWGPRGRVLGAS